MARNGYLFQARVFAMPSSAVIININSVKLSFKFLRHDFQLFHILTVRIDLHLKYANMNRYSFSNVALFLGSLIALTLSIVAIAIPYWEYVKLGGAERYYGLWKMCYNYRFAETCHQLGTLTFFLQGPIAKLLLCCCCCCCCCCC